MNSLSTWSLFFFLISGTYHQLYAEKEEEAYEEREEKKGSKIQKYLKPQYLIVPLLAIVGSSFVYFRYIREGDKVPEKEVKDSEEDDLQQLIDASGIDDEAKRKELKEKIKGKNLSAENLDSLSTQQIIDQLELTDEYAPILEELKQTLKKEAQEDDQIKEEPKTLFGIETKEDVVKWIKSLETLTQAQKEGLLNTVETNELNGEEVLSLNNQQEIKNCLNVGSTVAKKLDDALIKLKHPLKVGPNSGLTGLQNFNGDERNICYLNATVQLLLQSPPLVKALRQRQYFIKNKYVTKKENDPEQDMWADFVELAQQAVQPNAQQASFNPTYIATQLRKCDKRFKEGKMDDVFKAFNSMIEILHENFLKRMGAHIEVDEAPWQTIGLEGTDLEEKIDKFYEDYNPKHVSSPIRKMHFMLEESFEAVGLPEKHKHAEKWYTMKDHIELKWKNDFVDVTVDFYGNDGKKKTDTFNLKLEDQSTIRSLQYMIFDQLMKRNKDHKGYTAEDINIGYVDITEEGSKTGYVDTTDIKYPFEEFTIKELLEKKRYIFAQLESQKDKKQPKEATIQVNQTAINQAKEPATITTLEEGIKGSRYFIDYVTEIHVIFKKKYRKGSKSLIEDKKNKVPVKHFSNKIVRYPEVLVLYIRREDGNPFKKPIDFEEKMTLDGNKYHLGAAIYYDGIHYWAHVKSIDDGQWYEANDSKITKIGKEIMPFVRGEKAIQGGSRGREDLRGDVNMWMYVKEKSR
ncbi:MAG: hypothetical protein AAF335_01040 [Bacteroidota bacterium]